MEIPAELKAYRDALRRMGTDPSPLAARAESLVILPDSEFGQALKAFDAAANEHSYNAPAPDCDYGSLLLEALADGCADPRRRRRLYPRGEYARRDLRFIRLIRR
ncbi:MAG TPA: hypothetical protein VHU19_17850 [Pyrinomonadaceae bacterium]|jgi:hypothetical protein|nr:hypothetical protein [Pyrinomonadaceae bacterium]